MLTEGEEQALTFNAFTTPQTTSQLHRMDASVIDPTGLENAFSQMSIAAHNSGVSQILTDLATQVQRISAVPGAANLTVTRALTGIQDKIRKTFAESIAQNEAVNRNVSALAPTINFVTPEWTLAQLYDWANAEKVRHEYSKNVSWRAVPVGKCHYDSRASRPADPLDDAAMEANPNAGKIYEMLEREEGRPAQPEIPPVAGDGGDVQMQEYVAAAPPKPELPARRGYPAIVTGAPFAYEGPSPKEQEKNLLVYTHPDHQDRDHLDVVSTLLEFEVHANKSGYTKPLLMSFLRDLIIRKSGLRAFKPYESLEPNDIAARLVGIHFTPPPLNKIQEVVEFTRPVGESINQTYNKMRVMYKDVLYHIHDEQVRDDTCDDRIYHDILTLTNPILARVIKQLRMVDTVNQKSHPIEQDLYLINQIEELKPAFKPKAELKLTQRDIDRLPHHLDLNAMSMVPREQLIKAFPEHAEKAKMISMPSGTEVDLNTSKVDQSRSTKRKPDSQLTPEAAKRPDQSIKENQMTTSPIIPRRRVVAGRRLANRSASSERSTAEAIQREAMNAPLPDIPTTAKADPTTGRRAWYDSEALNRYSVSPSGRMNHYMANGDSKSGISFDKARSGFPGTKGDIAELRAANRETSRERQNNRWQERADADKRKASAFGSRPTDTRTFSRHNSRENPNQYTGRYRSYERERMSDRNDQDRYNRERNGRDNKDWDRHGEGRQNQDRSERRGDNHSRRNEDDSRNGPENRPMDDRPRYQRNRSESPFNRNSDRNQWRNSRDRTRTPSRRQGYHIDGVINTGNMAFWERHRCTKCGEDGHPATSCRTITCNKCGMKGEHKSTSHCDTARQAYYRSQLAFAPNPSQRRDRSKDPREVNTTPSANTILTQDQYQTNHDKILASIQNMEAQLRSVQESKN